MKDPKISPAPWRAHTEPASAMRIPKTTAMTRTKIWDSMATLKLWPSTSSASASRHHEAFVFPEAPVQFFDLVCRLLLEKKKQPSSTDVADAVGRARVKVIGVVGA